MAPPSPLRGDGSGVALLLALGLVILVALGLTVKMLRTPASQRESFGDVMGNVSSVFSSDDDAVASGRASPERSADALDPGDRNGIEPATQTGVMRGATVAGQRSQAASDRRYLQRAFDPLAWAEGQHSGRPGLDSREMVERIVAHRRLRRMTRAEVIDMLGEPSSLAHPVDGQLAYPVGPDARAASTDWLIVEFGSDGRVIDSRIIPMGE